MSNFRDGLPMFRMGLGILALLSLTACPRSSGAPDGGASPSAAKEPSREISEDEFEALMSLGYLNSTKARVDTTEVGVVRFDKERAHDGYRFYCTRGRAIATLMDIDGTEIQSWRDDGIENWSACSLMPNGDLIVVGLERHTMARQERRPRHRHIRRLSWDGVEIWRRDLSVHHDVFVLPDGDFLTLTLENQWRREIHAEAPVRDDYVARMTGDGEVLERRSILDVFASNSADLELHIPAKTSDQSIGPIDLIHANTVEAIQWPHLAERDPIYAAGNVIWTSRRQNVVAIVDWASNRLLWSWGQGELLGPHEGRVLANGNILIFDNGVRRIGSRVIEVDPASREIVWEYRGESPQAFFTSGRGGAVRLDNGNTLITESRQGRAFEVTPEGEWVWESLNPHLTKDDRRLTFRRMQHYSRDAIDRILSDLPRR